MLVAKEISYCDGQCLHDSRWSFISKYSMRMRLRHGMRLQLEIRRWADDAVMDIIVVAPWGGACRRACVCAETYPAYGHCAWVCLSPYSSLSVPMACVALDVGAR